MNEADRAEPHYRFMQNHDHRPHGSPSPFLLPCTPSACLVATPHRGAPSLNRLQWPLDLSPGRGRLIWNVVLCMSPPQPQSPFGVSFSKLSFRITLPFLSGAVPPIAPATALAILPREPWSGCTWMQWPLLGHRLVPPLVPPAPVIIGIPQALSVRHAFEVF